jgi:hypothetical protein
MHIDIDKHASDSELHVRVVLGIEHDKVGHTAGLFKGRE